MTAEVIEKQVVHRGGGGGQLDFRGYSCQLLGLGKLLSGRLKKILNDKSLNSAPLYAPGNLDDTKNKDTDK